MRPCRKRLLLVAGPAIALSACVGTYPDALPPQLSDIQRIQGNDDLSAQEKRAALAELGLSPLVINGILWDIRLGNQFGGDLRSAYDKVTGDQLDQLTPDEVQIFGDEASEIDPVMNYDLSDAEAQAIVTLFREEHISSPDELSDFLADPLKILTIPPEIPAGALSDLFVTFDTDLMIDRLP